MNEELMTTGFTGGDAATGPTAGYDPVMKFRKKRKKSRLPEQKEIDHEKHSHVPSRLFQYKVSMPTVGDTILYANSPAELMQKLRLLINPRYRGEINIERIMPANAAKFFMDKRSKHMRNMQEQEDKALQQQVTAQQIALEKQKVQAKVKAMQMQLQKKAAALKAKARVGGAQQTVDQG